MNSLTLLKVCPRWQAVLALFITALFAFNATAQVGLSKSQVQRDVSEKLAEASGSMLEVRTMQLLRSTETRKGRFEIDIQMTVKADERAIQDAIARSRANRLSSDWRQEAARIDRLAQNARSKDGLTENIQAVYQLSRAGAWQLTEVSDNTSEYTRRRNQNGEDSAPEETQVVREFESLIKLLSNDAVSISQIEIIDVEPVSTNQVKLDIQMRLESGRYPSRNAQFALKVNGLTNIVEVSYQRDNRGNWRQLQ